MKTVITIFTALFIAISANAQTNLNTTDLNWLEGNWQIDISEANIKVFETWKRGEGNSYIGEGYVLKGKDTIVREVIKIEKIGLHWVYIAQINDNAPVLFTLKVESTAKQLVFENLEHDNPQRVRYTFISKDEMMARTEAVVEGKEVGEDYPFVRR